MMPFLKASLFSVFMKNHDPSAKYKIMYIEVSKRYGSKQFFFFWSVPTINDMHDARFKKFIVANAVRNINPARWVGTKLIRN